MYLWCTTHKHGHWLLICTSAVHVWLLAKISSTNNSNPSVLVRLWYTKCQDGLDTSSAPVLSILVCVENTAKFSLRVLEVSKSPSLQKFRDTMLKCNTVIKICNSWFPSGTTTGVLRSYWGHYKAKLPNPTWKVTEGWRKVWSVKTQKLISYWRYKHAVL